MASHQQPQHDPAYLDEPHQRIAEFAGDYFDDDEERETFIDTLMERRGYQRQASWALPPDPDPGPPGGGRPGAAGTPPAGARRPAYFKR